MFRYTYILLVRHLNSRHTLNSSKSQSESNIKRLFWKFLFFSCEDTAQQVLISSVHLSVSKVDILPSYSNQNVPESSRMFQNVCIIFQNACIMFQNACRMFHNVLVCYMSLHEVSWAFIIYAVPFFVWAAHKNFEVIVVYRYRERFMNITQQIQPRLNKFVLLRWVARNSSLEADIGTYRDIVGFLRSSAFIWTQEVQNSVHGSQGKLCLKRATLTWKWA